MTYDLAFIGAGNMAEAIARGLIRTATVPADRLIAADPVEARRTLFSSELKIRALADAADAAKNADAILLAVKPQQISEVLSAIGKVLREQTLIISIAAGVSSQCIEAALGQGKAWRVIRTMPNTPMLVGQGAVAIAAGANASQADIAAARRFFEP
ncbi:MAG TPA: NAD(P)-binding domain-containing protein, partial [Tepidisphaeraceae bacterium]